MVDIEFINRIEFWYLTQSMLNLGFGVQFPLGVQSQTSSQSIHVSLLNYYTASNIWGQIHEKKNLIINF